MYNIRVSLLILTTSRGEIKETYLVCLFVYLMVLNATFNNITCISWRSVLLREETGGPGENHRPVASHSQTLSHNDFHLAYSKKTQGRKKSEKSIYSIF